MYVGTGVKVQRMDLWWESGGCVGFRLSSLKCRRRSKSRSVRNETVETGRS